MNDVLTTLGRESAASSEADEVLRIEGLTIGFGQKGQRRALTDVSLNVRAGEVVALVGESGCGKSLTALSIMGLLPPEAHLLRGSIRLSGIEMLGMSERQLRRHRGRLMGMIFQDAMVALNPLQPVGRQIDETLRIHTKLSRDQRRVKVVALLDSIGVPDARNRLRHLPHEFSGGLRQRIMIAMALIAEPRLVIADEPTTALDVTIQAQILEVLKEITAALGTAVLFITHDMGVVAEIADRVVVMYGGRVVETTSVVETFSRPAHPYTDALLHSVPRPDTPRAVDLPVIPGSVPAPGAAPSGCPFRPRCDNASDKCHTMPPLVPIVPAHDVACWHPHHHQEPKP